MDRAHRSRGGILLPRDPMLRPMRPRADVRAHARAAASVACILRSCGQLNMAPEAYTSRMHNALHRSVLFFLMALVGPAAAAGQLLPPSPEIAIPGVEYSHQAAHDPVYNMVLFASLDRDMAQALGRFLDNAGNPLGP